MRKIKVRGLLIESLANGDKWITADDEYHDIYINYADKLAHIQGHPVHYESISEYTGLKDKNGKEIYEGDVISVINGAFQAEIIYEAPSFKLHWQDKFHVKRNVSNKTIAWNAHIIYEIIGNIYNNPELLEGVTS